MQDWFLNMHFGMFVHWGLYSAAGGYWKRGKTPSVCSEWIQKSMRIPKKEYAELAKDFAAERFDADALARLAKESGARYLCFTAKHHDGFAMFDTDVSDYKITNTPFGRDAVRELADACGRQGVKFCVYYSQMQDWEDPNGFGNDWDFDPEKKDFGKYYENKVRPQVTELLSRYGKINMIWFDTPYTMPRDLCRDLHVLVKSLQPDCLINSRIGYGLGDYVSTGDNSMPAYPWKTPWELPMTMNHSWGYFRGDEDWKSAEKIVESLVSCVSKGGNLLLNVGPDGDGAVPEACAARMKAVGKWLVASGESVYGCSAAPVFPYVLPWGSVTVRGSCAYLHVFRYPVSGSVTIYGFLSKATDAVALATGEKLAFSHFYDPARDEKRITVALPKDRDPIDTVIKLTLVSPLEAAKGPDGK